MKNNVQSRLKIYASDQSRFSRSCTGKMRFSGLIMKSPSTRPADRIVVPFYAIRIYRFMNR